MDDIVKAALAKWPNVPDCTGWLGLDARGHWYMRDDRTQAAGPFAGTCQGRTASAASKGSLLRHDKLIAFIGRNYEADASGQWFFQNGPQRVYVELEVAPWVWRVEPSGALCSHTGRTATMRGVYEDERGHVLVDTELGLGLVFTQDVAQVADLIEQGRWPVPVTVRADEVPARFGFVTSPAAARLAAPDTKKPLG